MWPKVGGPDSQKNYAGVSIDTPRNFKVPASYLVLYLQNKIRLHLGSIRQAYVLVRLRIVDAFFPPAARWRFRRIPRRVCKLASYSDPRTYVRPAHFFPSFALGFFRRIVTPAIMRRTNVKYGRRSRLAF